jgi:hypothetical protein
MTIKYNFAKEFTKYPGGRYKRLGEYSGEEFREKVLEPIFQENDTIIELDTNGVVGSFTPSFLDEAFGAISRKYSVDKFKEKVIFLDKKLEEKTEEYLYE